MDEFNRNRYRQMDFDGLKVSFLGIGREKWSLEEIRRRMNKEEFQDLVNYRKTDFGNNMGQILADDFQKAMDELSLTAEERKRIAKYFLENRVGRVKDRLWLKHKDGWEETVNLLENVLTE